MELHHYMHYTTHGQALLLFSYSGLSSATNHGFCPVAGTPVEQLDFKFNLWVEALPLYQKGLLKLPPQTSLIMSDSGAGFIQGDAETFAHADGVLFVLGSEWECSRSECN
jgi:hypothetical protein